MRKFVIFTLFLFVASSAFASDAPKSLWIRDWLAESQRKVFVNSEVEGYSPEVADAYRHIDTIVPDVTVLLEDEFFFDIEGVRHFAKRYSLDDRFANEPGWFGYVDGGQFLSTFYSEGNRLGGQFVVAKFGQVRYYQLRPVFGKHLLEEVDVTKLVQKIPNDHISVERLGISAHGLAMEQSGKRRSIGVSFLDCSRGETPFYIVDLLGVYDTTALSFFGNKEDLAVQFQTMVNFLNSVLVDSGVTIGGFKLVDVRFANYTASGSSWDDLNWMVNSEEISAMSTETDADITSFMIGRAVDGGGWGGGPWNIWVVDYSWVLFVHENGHSIGLNHQPEQQPVGPNEEYPFARAHIVPGLFKTAVATSMNSCKADCPVIPLFSNPNVFYEGVATGVPNERNNALMASIKIPVISKLRQGTPIRCSATSLSGGVAVHQDKKE